MSRQHFVEDNTDRVNVARRTGLRQAKLLRRRITDRAERQRIRLDLLPQLSGNIEINQLEFVSAQQNIGRLDVPMHDPPAGAERRRLDKAALYTDTHVL